MPKQENDWRSLEFANNVRDHAKDGGELRSAVCEARVESSDRGNPTFRWRRLRSNLSSGNFVENFAAHPWLSVVSLSERVRIAYGKYMGEVVSSVPPRFCTLEETFLKN